MSGELLSWESVKFKVYEREVEPPVDLHFLWDMHLGPDDRVLKIALREIRDNPHAYFVLGGDNLEAIGGEDWRLQAGDYDALPPDFPAQDIPRAITEQALALARHVKPVADKCLLILSGNHERKLKKRSSVDVNYLISEILKSWGKEVPTTSEEVAILVLKLRLPYKVAKHREYVLALAHGWGGGLYPGAKMNRALWWAGMFDGIDAVVVGHTHDLMSGVFPKYEIVKRGGKKVVVMRPLHVIKPGGGRVEPTYAVRSGYRPTQPGWVIHRVWFGRAKNSSRVLMAETILKPTGEQLL